MIVGSMDCCKHMCMYMHSCLYLVSFVDLVHGVKVQGSVYHLTVQQNNSKNGTSS